MPGTLPLFETMNLPDRLDRAAEMALSRAHGHRLAGIDEAGRGPWAGPVAVAAVILDPGDVPDGLDDSKALTETAREALFDRILASSQVAIAFAGPATIDRCNIRAATLAAMARAARALALPPALCLVDGRDVPPGLPCPGIAVVRGDARLHCIAAASVVAKVARDRLMARMDGVWPAHGFARHKGYGTAAHAEALARAGVTPLHRRSFRPVADELAKAATTAQE